MKDKKKSPCAAGTVTEAEPKVQFQDTTNSSGRQGGFPRNQAEIAAARPELLQMLAALSDEALAYVWRPIMYAYYHTDGRDGDRLTDEDAMRMSLIGAAAHESTEFVERLSMFATALFHTKTKREREARR